MMHITSVSAKAQNTNYVGPDVRIDITAHVIDVPEPVRSAVNIRPRAIYIDAAGMRHIDDALPKEAKDTESKIYQQHFAPFVGRYLDLRHRIYVTDNDGRQYQGVVGYRGDDGGAVVQLDFA